MSPTARVARGEDQGDYQPRTSDYGAVFWWKGHHPGSIPMTDSTMKRWLSTGKAVLLETPPAHAAPAPDETKPCEHDPGPDEPRPLDEGETNWLAEVAAWSRAERIAVLRAAGVKRDLEYLDKHQLARALLTLRRRRLGRPTANRPETPRMPQEQRSAAPGEDRTASRHRPAAGQADPFASVVVVLCPGVVFPWEKN